MTPNAVRRAMVVTGGFPFIGRFAFGRRHHSICRRDLRCRIVVCRRHRSDIVHGNGAEGVQRIDSLAFRRDSVGRFRRVVRCRVGDRRIDRRLDFRRTGQCLSQPVDAVGKTFDAEVQRIVVAVGQVRVERGMERRDEPAAGAYARDRVEQGQPVILHGGKCRIGRTAVAAMGAGAPRLDHFDVQEQAL